MKIFQSAAEPVKQTVNQIREPREATRKTRPRKQATHQSEFVKNKARPLEIAAERKHRRQGDSDDFGIRYFDTTIFSMSARLEKIVNKTVYCKSAFAHSFVLFCELVWRQNSKRGHSFFQISNFITGNLG
ncbi:MAG: hypothetical protein WA584_21765 [Pyrinomonadaceae bacterium]